MRIDNSGTSNYLDSFGCKVFETLKCPSNKYLKKPNKFRLLCNGGSLDKQCVLSNTVKAFGVSTRNASPYTLVY